MTDEQGVASRQGLGKDVFGGHACPPNPFVGHILGNMTVKTRWRSPTTDKQGLASGWGPEEMCLAVTYVRQIHLMAIFSKI